MIDKIKAKFNQFKTWTMNNKGLAVLLFAGVGALIYMLFFKNRMQALDYTPGTSEGEVVTPSILSDGAGGSGGVGSDADSLFAFLDAMNQQYDEQFAVMQDYLAQTAQDLYDMITMQDVERRYNEDDELLSTATENISQYYSIPVTDIAGGYGGGQIVGTLGQLQEFYYGGSRNVDGSYSMDFAGWLPTGATQINSASTLAQVLAHTPNYGSSSGSGSYYGSGTSSSLTTPYYASNITPISTSQLASMGGTNVSNKIAANASTSAGLSYTNPAGRRESVIATGGTAEQNAAAAALSAAGSSIQMPGISYRWSNT